MVVTDIRLDIKKLFVPDKESRKALDMAVNKIWRTRKEDFTAVYISYLHYLFKGKGQRLKRMAELSGKGLDLRQLVQDNLLDYLDSRYAHRAERHKLSKILISPKHNILNEKENLNHYLWGENGDKYNADIKRAMKDLFSLIRQTPGAGYFKEKLREALCLHPEKILEAYDYSDPLNLWREKTVGRILTQIGDDFVLERIKAEDEVVTHNVFFTDNDCRKYIDYAITSMWETSEDEDHTGVVMTFMHYLTQKNYQELRKIKKNITCRAPYTRLPFLGVPLRDCKGSNTSDPKLPKTWVEYNDEGKRLYELLYDSVSDYLDYKEHVFVKKGEYADISRRQNKEERIEHQRLLVESDQVKRKEYLWGDGSLYDSKIKSTLIRLGKNYKNLPTFDDVKNNLEQFLCGNTKDIFVQYDFMTTLDKWRNDRANIFIGNYPLYSRMLDDDGTTLHIFITEMLKVPLATKAKDTNIVEKPLEQGGETGVNYISEGLNIAKSKRLEPKELESRLLELFVNNDKKVLKGYKYEGSLRNFVLAIADNYRHKLITKPVPKPKDPIKKQNQDAVVVEIKDKARRLGLLIEILEKPGRKEFFGFEGQDEMDFKYMIAIVKAIHVDLVEYTKKEQRSKRKEILKPFEGSPDYKEEMNKLRVQDFRAIRKLDKVEKKIEELIKKKVLGRKISPMESQIIYEYLPNIDDALFKI